MATTPVKTAPDAIKTASFCQKSKASAKKAKYSTMKANHVVPATIVPAILAPKLRMMGYVGEFAYMVFVKHDEKCRNRRCCRVHYIIELTMVKEKRWDVVSMGNLFRCYARA